MANVWYQEAVEAFSKKLLDWEGDDFRALFVTSGYVFSQSHEFLSDVPGGNRVGTAVALSNKVASNGGLLADPTLFSNFSGSAVDAIIIYQHTGTEGTSRLTLYIDTGTNVTFNPNGGNVTINWPTPLAVL